MAEQTESTFIDSFFNYLKERVDSPLIPAFIFAWAFTNIDFLIHLFLMESPTKYKILVDWDFSGFLFWGYSSSPYLYADFANSFWNPFFTSLLIVAVFPSFNGYVTAAKYTLESKARELAKRKKLESMQAEELAKAKTSLAKTNFSLEKSKEDLNASKNQLLALSKSIEEKSTQLKNIEIATFYHEKAALFNLIYFNLKLVQEYNDNQSDFNLVPAKKIGPQSLISYRIGGENLDLPIRDVPISELFLKSTLFCNDDEQSIRTLYSLIFDMKINQTIVIKNLKEFEITHVVDIVKK